jgi:hypothetical protein
MARFSMTKPEQSSRASSVRAPALLRQALEGSDVGSRVRSRACWPSHRHQLLLKTLLLPDRQAAAAWRQWRARNDPNLMDAAASRLIPELFHRLRQLRIDDPWLLRFRGGCRRTWAAGQRLVQQTLPALDTFHRARIPVVAVKGLALTIQYNAGDLGLRSMFDLDLLIPTARVHDAIDQLLEAGWRFNSHHSIQELRRVIVPREHAREFVKDFGHVDLHWHMLHQDPSEWTDEWVWHSAKLSTFHGRPLSLPSPETLLLHVCLHGVRWCKIPSVMWAVDACKIINGSGNTIDWNGLVDIAVRRRLVVPLLDSFTFLAKSLAAPIPDPVLARLRKAPTSRAENLEYEGIVSAPAERTPEAAAAMECMVSLRQSGAVLAPDTLDPKADGALADAGRFASRRLPFSSRAVRARW